MPETRRVLIVPLLAALLTFPLRSQTDWPGYGRDKGAQRYSPLDQINVGNVSKLVPAWTFAMKKEGAPFRLSQSIPLVVNGTMYLSWPFNHVAALEPETGKLIWQYTAQGDFRGKEGSMRSVEYWPGDTKSPPEILFATEDGELFALNAKTGKPIPGFGNEGIVNLKTPEVMNGFPNLHLGVSSAPFVYKDLVITGSHIVDETGKHGPAGDVRAWDVRTGKLVWTFHSVPRPGEPGHETWQGDQWKNQSGVNVWTFFTADTERGLAIRFGQQRFLWNGPAGRQPVRQLAGGGGCPHGKVEVVVPGDSSRSLGL